ncbi:MAG: hypothetical protein ACI8P3_002641 [Saprospiraceae bacterium]|jgi:hypothetical protein
MKKFCLLFFLGILFSQILFAQDGVNKEKFRLAIKRAVDKIELDGKHNEESWKVADVSTQFKNKWPTDEGTPPLQTTVRMTYDDKNLYVAALCKEENTDHVVQTLKRDNVIWSSDGFGIFLDPVNQQTNGFAFFTNAYGVQTEGLLSAFSSGDEGMNRDWDNKWFTEVHQTAEGDWSVEMAIPFKSIRYEAGVTEWGINFIRCDLGNNIYSTWSFIPLQFDGTDLSYAGTLVWDNPPPRTKSNFSIIPYITGDISRDIEEGNGDVESSYDAGLDAKIAVTSSLNLDLTVNPDFSQIEVDEQQTNLTRFSLFFPEKRTFFLENSDIFSDFGIPPMRPFFSRRIGLDDDGNPIPILFGARLSGNATKDLRVGLLTMQTRATDNVKGQNYSVAVLQQKILKRSSIKGIVINRQSYEDGSFDKDDFSRNAGGEFTFITEDGSFATWLGYNSSINPEKFKSTGFGHTGISYNSRKFSLTTSLVAMGENYIADVGFINRLENYDADRDTTIRIGFKHWFQDLGYTIFPKKENGMLNFSKIQLENYMVWNDGFGYAVRNTQLGFNAFFQNTSWFNIGVEHTSEYLPFPSNFTDEEYENLPAGWYHYGNIKFRYRSNSRKLFSYNLNGNFGRFYNGTLYSFGANVQYRKQPWGTFAINFERNILTLPEEYGEAKLWLIGPKIEVNFSKSIFWTTFIQYNTQADNFNINSRIQWRYQPMSDLFLVYTDNYTAENFGLKSRAIVLKFNYWLTI